ncbi:MAG: hypothetical protein QOI50_4949 [Pseudonocardiales bacterium]|nr:hypothetical protein [Pseudonocardiales bacterium]
MLLIRQSDWPGAGQAGLGTSSTVLDLFPVRYSCVSTEP